MPDRAKQAKGRVATRTATGSVAALPASISDHHQSTLPDGRVIVSGSGVTYIYAPSGNEWEEMATVPASFANHGQSALVDGRVVVSVGSASLNVTYIYSADSNAWITASPLPTGFWSHGQSALDNGKILVSGGQNSSGYIDNSYIYTSSSNTWTAAASLQSKIAYFGQSTIKGSKVLVSGGWNGNLFNTAYIYNTDNNTWVSVATLSVAALRLRQSTLLDGRVLLSGGTNSSSSINIFNTAYIFTPDAGIGSWASAASLTTGISSHGQSTLSDGRVLVSGGYGNYSYLSAAYIYTPAGWEARAGKLLRGHRVDGCCFVISRCLIKGR